MHHRQVIRADPNLLADLPPDPAERVDAPLPKTAKAKRPRAKAPETQAFPPPPIPAWARASGRAGEGDPLFAAGAGLALLDAFLRHDPPGAGALRKRLALMSAAASAKILRLNADEGALRDLRFAVGDALGPAANSAQAMARSRRAGRPASTQAGSATRRRALDLAVDPNGLAARPEGLRRGGRSGFGGRKSRRPGVLRRPGRPSSRSRNPRPLAVRPRHSRSGCAGRGRCR